MLGVKPQGKTLPRWAVVLGATSKEGVAVRQGCQGWRW